METNLKHNQTVLSMAVALWWQLLVSLLAFDGGTGPFTILPRGEGCWDPWCLSTEITQAQQRGTDRVRIEFSLPSQKQFPYARLWIRLLGPLIRLWTSVTQIRFLWWQYSVCQTHQKNTWNEDRSGEKRKGGNSFQSPKSSIDLFSGVLTTNSFSCSPLHLWWGWVDLRDGSSCSPPASLCLHACPCSTCLYKFSGEDDFEAPILIYPTVSQYFSLKLSSSLIGFNNILITTNMVSPNIANESANVLKRSHEDGDDDL